MRKLLSLLLITAIASIQCATVIPTTAEEFTPLSAVTESGDTPADGNEGNDTDTETPVFEISEVSNDNGVAVLRVANNSDKEKTLLLAATLWDGDVYRGKSAVYVKSQPNTTVEQSINYKSLLDEDRVVELVAWEYIDGRYDLLYTSDSKFNAPEPTPTPTPTPALTLAGNFNGKVTEPAGATTSTGKFGKTEDDEIKVVTAATTKDFTISDSSATNDNKNKAYCEEDYLVIDMNFVPTENYYLLGLIPGGTVQWMTDVSAAKTADIKTNEWNSLRIVIEPHTRNGMIDGKSQYAAAAMYINGKQISKKSGTDILKENVNVETGYRIRFMSKSGTSMPLYYDDIRVWATNDEPSGTEHLTLTTNGKYTVTGKTVSGSGLTVADLAVDGAELTVFKDNTYTTVVERGNVSTGNVAVYCKDNVYSYYNLEVTEASVASLNIENGAGDLTFFDNRFCNLTPAEYKNFSASPKTNTIETKRLEDYQSADRKNYIYMNKTDSGKDCYIDITTNIPSQSKNPDMQYSYYKFEGDFTVNTLGSKTYLPLIRDSKTTGSQVNQLIALLMPDGSLKVGDETISDVAKVGETFHLLVAINLKSHKADVYIDGVKKVSDFAISEDIKQINMFRICLATDTGDLKIDNFNVTGLVNPIVDGVETKTSIMTSETEIEDFLANKIAMHAYGNILAKGGEKIELEDGIYDKDTQQYYVTADVLSQAFDMTLTDNGNGISGDVTIDSDGNAETKTGSTLKFKYTPIQRDGKLYIPVEQFAIDIACKHVWKHETGIFLFTDTAMEFDTSEWDYKSKQEIGCITEFTDLDFFNFYLQYVRPKTDRLDSDYQDTNGTDYAVHPRIGLNATQFAEHKSHYNLQDDELYNKVSAWAIQQADDYLNRDLVEYTWSDSIRTQTTIAGELKLRFIYWGYAYQMTGDTKYVTRAYEQFEKIATYPDFNPQHVLDIGAACWALAVGYDWLYDGYTAEQRENIVEIIDTMATDVLGSGLYGRLSASGFGTPAWSEFKWSSNINMYISSGLMTAAMATLESNTDEKLGYIQEGLRAVEYSLQLLAPGGAWVESPSYWNFAMQPFSFAVSSLENTFGQSYNLLSGQGMDNTLMWMMSVFGNNGTNSYGDCSVENITSYDSFAYLGKRYDNDVARLARREQIEEKGGYTYMDLTFFDFDAKELTDDAYDDISTTVRADGVEYISFRDTYDRKNSKMYFSTHFGTTSGYHQHNDCGTFVLDLNGYRWASDLGQPDYLLENEMGYADYEVYKKRAESHNVLVLNPSGHSDSFEMNLNKFAPIVKSASNAKGGYVYANMDGVYAEASKMTLGYYLDDDMQSVTMRNEFTTETSCAALWGITTPADAEIVGDTVVLTQGSESVVLEFCSDGGNVHWEITDAEPLSTSPNPTEQVKDTGYKRVVLWFDTNAGENTLSVKISPKNVQTKEIINKKFDEWMLP